MIPKLLDSQARPAIAVLRPSCAYFAACSALWLLWPSSSCWLSLASGSIV